MTDTGPRAAIRYIRGVRAKAGIGLGAVAVLGACAPHGDARARLGALSTSAATSAIQRAFAEERPAPLPEPSSPLSDPFPDVDPDFTVAPLLAFEVLDETGRLLTIDADGRIRERTEKGKWLSIPSTPAVHDFVDLDDFDGSHAGPPPEKETASIVMDEDGRAWFEWRRQMMVSDEEGRLRPFLETRRWSGTSDTTWFRASDDELRRELDNPTRERLSGQALVGGSALGHATEARPLRVGCPMGDLATLEPSNFERSAYGTMEAIGPIAVANTRQRCWAIGGRTLYSIARGEGHWAIEEEFSFDLRAIQADDGQVRLLGSSPAGLAIWTRTPTLSFPVSNRVRASREDVIDVDLRDGREWLLLRGDRLYQLDDAGQWVRQARP